MKSGHKILSAVAVAGSMCLGLGVVPASAQTKPPESATKVKKVLLYNKIGGWVHVDGSADVKTVMTRLAAKKGFQLTQLADDGSITLDFLKGFQVIVWNNNTNGGSSVPSSSARTAVLNYVNQGGGWLLIHGAGDHGDSWAELRSAMGTKFTTHGAQGAAEAVIDNAAKQHPELKFAVEGLPATIRLTDEWYSFNNTVRAISGVTVIATARAVSGANGVIVPLADGSGDFTYIWARQMQQGRLVYNAIGHGQNQLMAQGDSVVPKIYWENLRYLAGDYAVTTSINAETVRNGLTISRGSENMRLEMPLTGSVQVRLFNLSGVKVWESTLPASTSEISLDEGIKAGVYQLEARSGKSIAHQRIVLK